MPCAPGAPNFDSASVTYTPNPGFTGSDSFTYKAYDGTFDSIATVSISVQSFSAASPSVSSIWPNTLQAGTSVDVEITGSNFAEGATVRFEDGKGSIPDASNEVVVDANTIRATVAMKGGGPKRSRVWDVVVTNPDGQLGKLVDSFTVEP